MCFFQAIIIQKLLLMNLSTVFKALNIFKSYLLILGITILISAFFKDIARFTGMGDNEIKSIGIALKKFSSL